MDYHIASVADTAHELGMTPSGLNAATAQQRLAEHGKNELADAKKKTVAQLLLQQFTDVMILVLLAAAVISGMVGEVESTYVILAIVLLNVLVGFLQEYRASKAMMETLRKMAAS